MQPRAGLILPMLAAATLVGGPTPGRAQAPVQVNAPPGLNLTPAQQARANALQQQYVKTMTALQGDKTMTPAQQAAKMRATAQAHDKEMLAILTPSQHALVMAQRAAQLRALQGQRKAAQAFQSSHKAEIAAGSSLAAKLNKTLTPGQKTQIDGIRKQLAVQGQSLQANTTLSPQAKQQQWLGDQQSAQTKMLAVLTPSQKTDYLKMQQMQKQLLAESRASQTRK